MHSIRQAIQTNYKGYRFRSRLEARWAVFLDAMKEPWEYEKEGYRLADGTVYLADFWLPRLNLWLEVKGKDPTVAEYNRCAMLRDVTGSAVAIFQGLPLECGGWLYCWEHAMEGDSKPWTGLIELSNDGEGRLQLDAVRFEVPPVLWADRANEHPLDLGHACGGWVEICADEARSARFEFGENGEKPKPRPLTVYLAGKVGGAKQKVAAFPQQVPLKFVCSDGGNHSEHDFGCSSWDFEECDEGGSLREAVHDCAIEELKRADMVFAYLDTSDSYGSIAEIAYASAIGKAVFVAVLEADEEAYCDSTMFDAYWFVSCFPNVKTWCVGSVESAAEKLAIAAGRMWRVLRGAA